MEKKRRAEGRKRLREEQKQQKKGAAERERRHAATIQADTGNAEHEEQMGRAESRVLVPQGPAFPLPSPLPS